MQRRHLLPGLAVATLAALIACKGGDPPGGGRGGRPGGEGGPAAEKDAIAVKTDAVALRPIAQTYSTSTTLGAEQEATVIARTTGVIERLIKEEGDRVQAGEPVAQLEDDEQAITLARAKLTRDARAREYERQQQLHAQDLTSDVDLEQSRSAAEDAEEALKLATLDMERTTIRAPLSGIVLRRHLDVGASVSSGTAVYDIADVDPLIAEVRIPERHVAALKAGQEARLYADASGEAVAGRILRIAPWVDPTSGTVKVTVATAGRTGLRPGAFVKVDIVTATHDAALVVPRSALVAEGRRWYVFEAPEGAETVQRRAVSLGFEEGDGVELLPPEDGGAFEIAAADRVVVLGAPALTDGARIQIVDDSGAVAPGPETPAPGAADAAPAASGQP